MLEDAYLVRGLNALSRAHQTDYFADGHRGAAIVAPYFFCREVDVQPGVSDVVRAIVDEHWTHTPLCAPFPEERPEPELLSRIVETLPKYLSGLRQAGHNVILPTMALKAFRRLPETITLARVEGVCKLIESFSSVSDVRLEEGDDLPALGAARRAAELILTELLGCLAAFDGRGQGWSGHLLTYGRALLDLREMGYASLSARCEPGFQLYIKRVRMGPLETDVPRPEHPPSDLRPHQRAYWEGRRGRSVGIGHLFKYPYGFYGLTALAQDASLIERCMRAAYRIF